MCMIYSNICKKQTFNEVPHKHLNLPRTFFFCPQTVRRYQRVRLIFLRHVLGEKLGPLLPMELLIRQPFLSPSDDMRSGGLVPPLLVLQLLHLPSIAKAGRQRGQVPPRLTGRMPEQLAEELGHDRGVHSLDSLELSTAVMCYYFVAGRERCVWLAGSFF